VQQVPDPGEHGVHSGSYLLDRFTRVVRVAGNHAIGPQVPAGTLVPDLGAGAALVSAVVPFPQLRLGRDAVQTGQLRGALRSGCGADQHMRQRVGREPRAERSRLFLPNRCQRDVGPAGVAPRPAPLSLAVTNDYQLARIDFQGSSVLDLGPEPDEYGQ